MHDACNHLSICARLTGLVLTHRQLVTVCWTLIGSLAILRSPPASLSLVKPDQASSPYILMSWWASNIHLILLM